MNFCLDDLILKLRHQNQAEAVLSKPFYDPSLSVPFFYPSQINVTYSRRRKPLDFDHSFKVVQKFILNL